MITCSTGHSSRDANDTSILRGDLTERVGKNGSKGRLRLSRRFLEFPSANIKFRHTMIFIRCGLGGGVTVTFFAIGPKKGGRVGEGLSRFVGNRGGTRFLFCFCFCGIRDCSGCWYTKGVCVCVFAIEEQLIAHELKLHECFPTFFDLHVVH